MHVALAEALELDAKLRMLIATAQWEDADAIAEARQSALARFFSEADETAVNQCRAVLEQMQMSDRQLIQQAHAERQNLLRSAVDMRERFAGADRYLQTAKLQP